MLTTCRTAAALLVAALALMLLDGSTSPAQQQQQRPGRQRSTPSTPPTNPFAPEMSFEDLFTKPAAEASGELDKISISLADERQLGDSMVEAYLADLRRQKLKVRKRGRDVDYLGDLVETLRPFMTNKSRYPTITVYVVDSPQTDARSFPGGTLFFLRGLLDFAGSEAALLGIVGHELSHLDRGHQLAPLKRMKYFEQTLADGPGGASPERMMSAIHTMVAGYARPFQPEDESQADRDGAAWSFRAGYDPREMAELFLKLHHRDANRPAVTMSFLRTHPFHIDRSRAIQRQYTDLQGETPTDKLYVGRRNLMERTARSRREFAED